MKSTQELRSEAEKLEGEARSLRDQAATIDRNDLKAKPLADRIIYAARDRCRCGAGLAYDPVAEDESSPFVGPLSGYWECFAVMNSTADPAVKHEERLPFAFYEIKSELQPSANGATTRPPISGQ